MKLITLNNQQLSRSPTFTLKPRLSTSNMYAYPTWKPYFTHTIRSHWWQWHHTLFINITNNMLVQAKEEKGASSLFCSHLMNQNQLLFKTERTKLLKMYTWMEVECCTISFVSSPWSLFMWDWNQNQDQQSLEVTSTKKDINLMQKRRPYSYRLRKLIYRIDFCNSKLLTAELWNHGKELVGYIKTLLEWNEEIGFFFLSDI